MSKSKCVVCFETQKWNLPVWNPPMIQCEECKHPVCAKCLRHRWVTAADGLKVHFYTCRICYESPS